MIGKTVQGDIWEWLKQECFHFPCFELKITRTLCLTSLAQHLALRSPQLVGDGEGGGGENEVEEDEEERHTGFPTLNWELRFRRSLGHWKLYFYFDCRTIPDSSRAGRMGCGIKANSSFQRSCRI